MPLKRDRSIPFVIMAGGLVLCWLLPGRAQVPTEAGARLPRPAASVPGGLCDAPFSLKFTAASEGALIRYTLDGTEPTLTDGDVGRRILVEEINAETVRAEHGFDAD